jgi:hypothetical protein
MKNILTRVLIGLTTFLIIYLLISFVKLTLNFTQWNEEARFAFILFGSLISLFISTAPYEIYKKEKGL